MSHKNQFDKLIGGWLAAAFILAGCNAATPPVATASPMASLTPIAPSATFTAVPSETETAAPIPTASLTATATEPATPTEELTPQVNPGWNAYCRKGPGTNYTAVTFLQAGTNYIVIGQDGRNTWWLVQLKGNITCWVGDPTSVLLGPVWQVSILPAPPLPQTPSEFAATYTCDPKLRSLIVVLEWVPVPNITGYHLYRNGSLLAGLEPTVKTYQDNSAPLMVNLVYKLEAFNDYGVSPRVSATVTPCGD
jgi:hypothetical protein